MLNLNFCDHLSDNSKHIFVQANKLKFPGQLKCYIYSIVSPSVKPCVQNLGSEYFSISTNVFPVKMKHFQMKVVRTLHNKCGALLLLLLSLLLLLLCTSVFIKLLLQFFIIKVWDGYSSHLKIKRESVIFLLVTYRPFVPVGKKKVPRGNMSSKYHFISHFLQFPIYQRK